MMEAASQYDSSALGLARRLHASERGEGVISTAIAVLVMAFLGITMWFAFQGVFNSAEETVTDQVDRIGEGAP
jgi:hypothetical protein